MEEILTKWVTLQNSMTIGNYEIHFVRYYDKVVQISNIRELAREMKTELEIHPLGHGAYLGSFKMLDWTFEGVFHKGEE